MRSGAIHGSSRADIFGNLYFYLSDQLQEFANRLDRFNISFHLFNEEAGMLADNIRAGGFGLSPRMTFDRIAVSNIVDPTYVGLARVLEDWGPLLNEANRYSKLLAYSLNWPMHHTGAEPGKNEISGLLDRMRQLGRVSPDIGISKMNTDGIPEQIPSPPAVASPALMRGMSSYPFKLSNKLLILPA